MHRPLQFLKQQVRAAFFLLVFRLHYTSSGVEILSQLPSILTTLVLLLIYFVYSSVSIYQTFTRFIRQCPAWLAVSIQLQRNCRLERRTSDLLTWYKLYNYKAIWLVNVNIIYLFHRKKHEQKEGMKRPRKIQLLISYPKVRTDKCFIILSLYRTLYVTVKSQSWWQVKGQPWRQGQRSTMTTR